MLVAYIYGLGAIICCFLGAYLLCEHGAWVRSYICMGLAITLMFCCVFASTFSAIEDTKAAYDVIIAEKDTQIGYYEENYEVKTQPKVSVIPECKIVEAQMGESVEVNGVWSTTFYVGDSEVQCFVWESEHQMEDVPYMLTMSTNGTDVSIDDEIQVVWQCVDKG